MNNPHEHTQQDEHDHPLYCRSCGGYLGQYADQTPATVQYFGGWPYCPDHADEMRLLALDPDQRDLAGQEREARIDMDRDDFVDQVRR